jgi:hypothetical protein
MQLLSEIILDLYNLKGFIHGNGIEWMSYLGSNNSKLTPGSLKRDAASTCDDSCQNLLNNLVAVFISEGINIGSDYYPAANFPNLVYTFPDADFCIFKNFSFNKLIVVTWNEQFKNNKSLLSPNCSCTLLWLLRNLALVTNFQSN